MKLRVWWIPQVPGKSFYFPVDTAMEGAKIMNCLAEYDRFQFDNKIKPDYANTGGLQMFEDGSWTDWLDEETWEDDPRTLL